MKRSRLNRRPLIKYEIAYVEPMYGGNSPMLALRREHSTSLKDAKEWIKVISKDKNVKEIHVNKLPKREWF